MSKLTSGNSCSSKCDSSKTPGGISKSLLTPIRRLGLSRNWKKSGPSPFVSPLSRHTSSDKAFVIEKKPPRNKKHTRAIQDNEIDEEESAREVVDSLSDRDENASDIVTPLGAVKETSNTRAFRKTLHPILNETIEEKEVCIEKGHFNKCKEPLELGNYSYLTNFEEEKCVVREGVLKLHRKKSLKKVAQHLSNPKNIIKNVTGEAHIESNKVDIGTPKRNNTKLTAALPNKSPNLTKKCIVLIQKKINENLYKKTMPPASVEQPIEISDNVIINPVSQALFDSDSDDDPLSKLTNKKSNENVQLCNKKRTRQLASEDDDDFCESTKVVAKVKKLENKNTSTGDLKPKTSSKIAKYCKNPEPEHLGRPKSVIIPSAQSSNSIDNDDDDFEVDQKKTILIRKTYGKVIKPHKAKSTGSVTQKDIDELKARIKYKKNMLLVKAMSKDTDELRCLIKKWNKGCQDALTELMGLMKVKLSEKQFTDFSEILKMLNIPSNLVGYDSDNDCFVSPDDTDIILSKFNF